jgi:hypothetical protein
MRRSEEPEPVCGKEKKEDEEMIRRLKERTI